jgi:hypothetical protein
VDAGVLVIDEQRLLYPGDLLHEAGHLALLAPSQRMQIGGEMGDDLGFEIGAIAWSYAAAKHLKMDPFTVFHDGGYRGSSKAFVENFEAGRYVGVPILEWLGLSLGDKSAKALNVPAYPSMLRWVRDSEIPAS